MSDTPDSEVTFRNDDKDNNEPEIGQGDNVHLNDNFEVYQDAHDVRPDFDELECERRRRNTAGEVLVERSSKTGLPVKPEPYNGTEDWEEYISHFELCSTLGKWSDQERVLALAASLRGPARTFYISLTAEEKANYEDLVKELGQRFGSTRHQNKWLSKLEGRKRQQDESIAALADDLRQMSQRAYRNLDSRAQEALALNQLYKSISLEMKCRCIDRNCRTVAQAVDIVERYEAILGDGIEKRRAVRMVTNVENGNNNSSTSNVARALQDVVMRLERLENIRRNRDVPNGQQSSSPAQNTRSCFRCNSPDHFIRDCPHPNNPQSTSRGQGRGSRRQQSGNYSPSSQ